MELVGRVTITLINFPAYIIIFLDLRPGYSLTCRFTGDNLDIIRLETLVDSTHGDNFYYN